MNQYNFFNLELNILSDENNNSNTLVNKANLMSLVSIFFAYNDVNDSFGGIVIELVNNCCHSIEVDDNIDIDDNIYQFELFFRYGNNNGNDVVVENAGENDDAK